MDHPNCAFWAFVYVVCYVNRGIEVLNMELGLPSEMQYNHRTGASSADDVDEVDTTV